MPIYEYACGRCQREFEVEQRISDDPIKTCPHCRSRKVKRLISQTSFVLKGGGWYSDLYSSAKAEPGGKSDGEGAGGDDKKPAKEAATSDQGGEAKPKPSKTKSKAAAA